MPISAASVEKARSGEPFAERRHIDAAEFFVWRDRQFERGALQMIDENLEIIGLDVSMFRRAAEEIIGMLDDELVERRGGSD